MKNDLSESLCYAQQLKEHVSVQDFDSELLLCGLAADGRPSSTLLFLANITTANCHRLICLEDPISTMESLYSEKTQDVSDWQAPFLQDARECAAALGHDKLGTEHLLEILWRRAERDGLLDQWAQRIGFGDSNLVRGSLDRAREETDQLLAHPSYPFFFRGKELLDDPNLHKLDEDGRFVLGLEAVQEASFWKIMNPDEWLRRQDEYETD